MLLWVFLGLFVCKDYINVLCHAKAIAKLSHKFPATKFCINNYAYMQKLMK